LTGGGIDDRRSAIRPAVSGTGGRNGVRTPLTWYGGKQRLAPRIVAMMPAHRGYLEPFAGGAAVLSAKPRADRETLNDLDGRVVRFWRVPRERLDELAHAVALAPYSRVEWNDCKDNPDAVDDLEAARRFRVSVDQAFSREGTGWSPPSIAFDRRGRWQAGVWQNIPAKLTAAAERLSGVALECADALSLIERYDQLDAVIYATRPTVRRSGWRRGRATATMSTPTSGLASSRGSPVSSTPRCCCRATRARRPSSSAGGGWRPSTNGPSKLAPAAPSATRRKPSG
jgi:hypothetical protein